MTDPSLCHVGSPDQKAPVVLSAQCSVVLQSEGQQHGQPHTQDEGEALQQPHAFVLVTLRSCVLLVL